MLSITRRLTKSGNYFGSKGKIFLFAVLFTVFLFNTASLAQEFVCGTPNGVIPANIPNGGLHIPSLGTLKVLVVFVRFKDDTGPHNYWPSNGFPSFANTYLDPNSQTGSSHYLNLTNYYRTMSTNDRLLVVGEVKNIVTNENRAYYFNAANYGSTNPRYFATKKVLQDQVDPLVNFNTYDNWSYNSNSNPPHINQPDGTVDMIIMIWRGLQFSSIWGGEASLGDISETLPNYTVENGTKTIKARFGANLGSGVTVHSNGGKWPEYNFHTAVHEVAHWLLGSGHPYGADGPNNHEFWGMLVPASFGICANAYEREKLIWIKPAYPVVNITGDMVNTPIEDFVTTGRIYKYHPSNGGSNEWYYFENHQKLNIYDNATVNSNDKGIFVLHQGGNYQSGDNIRVKTSNGQWDWRNTGNATCFDNQTVPKLKPASINRAGKNNRDKFGVGANAWLFYLDGWTTGTWPPGSCGGWLYGEGLNNSFNATYNNVFSPYSNPYTHTWSGSQNNFTMEIISQNGSIVNAKYYITNPIGGKPAKPQALTIGPGPSSRVQLNWAANIDPDLSIYEISRKDDVYGNIWSVIATTTNTNFVDWQRTYTPSGYANTTYRIRAKDTQVLYSIYSDEVSTKTVPTGKANSETVVDQEFEYKLENYPNPFNPTTKIRYSIKEAGLVSLKVFDILGKEVMVLVNEEKPAGVFESEFDASNLPSGVYFYTMHVNNFVSSKKMMLIK
jgi:hypothetical protein